MAEHLEPCPFCGVTLERSDAFSTRRRDTYMHPPTDAEPCILSNIIIADADRIEAWNTRLNPPAASGGGEP